MKKKKMAVMGLVLVMTAARVYAAESEIAGSAGAESEAPGSEASDSTGKSGEASKNEAPGGMGSGGEAPNGEAPGGEMGGGPGGEAPGGEMPGGMGPGGEAPNGEAPDGMGPGGEAPNGEAPDGMAPGGEAPGGIGPGGEAPDGEAPGGMAQGVENYDAVENPSEDTTIENQEITSTGADENAVLVDGDVEVSLLNDTITRSSADSTGGDNASFYGVGAAVLGTSGTTVVDGCTITTDASGGAGVFAYGDGTVYVSDTTIETAQDTSGGIHAAGGGTLYAWYVTAETNGRSAAAVRSDRGGGTMVVDGGSYTSNGADSPAVYCTANISIQGADLTANGSEAVCIEGLNTLRLYDCALSGNMADDERNDNTWTVIVYQSMSGDSAVGNGVFQMKGGSLTSGNGGLFFTTNTESTITLEDVEITSAEDCEFFLQCTGNTNSRGWGQQGSNGADCLFTAIDQKMDGDILWDSISELDLYLTEGSDLTGAVIQDETYAGPGGDGRCKVCISEDSTWTVTGDSTVSALYASGTIQDEAGKTVTVLGGDGTVYAEGDSAYTITVDTYADTVDLSGASAADSFADHEAARPEA